jgi:hypothetical protein
LRGWRDEQDDGVFPGSAGALGLQADYDLEEARKAAQNELKKVEYVAA